MRFSVTLFGLVALLTNLCLVSLLISSHRIGGAQPRGTSIKRYPLQRDIQIDSSADADADAHAPSSLAYCERPPQTSPMDAPTTLRILFVTLEYRVGAFSGNGVYGQATARALSAVRAQAPFLKRHHNQSARHRHHF